MRGGGGGCLVVPRARRRVFERRMWAEDAVIRAGEVLSDGWLLRVGERPCVSRPCFSRPCFSLERWSVGFKLKNVQAQLKLKGGSSADRTLAGPRTWTAMTGLCLRPPSAAA